MPQPQQRSAPLTFDDALFTVSECLVEARCALDRNEERRAHLLYTAAERYALGTRYMELLSLVWAHTADHLLKPTASPPPGHASGE